MDIKLGDVQTTALIPLVIKANETQRANPRIRDEKAVEIIRQLGVETQAYDKFFSHEGVVARTILFDRAMNDLLKKYPDANVINIGSGFDNRFSRVDNGIIGWYDVDLPDCISVRAKAFPERKRVTMVSGDILQTDWMAQIPKDKMVIVIAEGLFMYFTREETKIALQNLVTVFPKGYLLSEMMCKFATKDKGKHHDTVRSTNAQFKWGTDSGDEFVALAPRLRLVEENSFNVVMKDFGLRCKLFATLFPKINNRLAVFQWG